MFTYYYLTHKIIAQETFIPLVASYDNQGTIWGGPIYE